MKILLPGISDIFLPMFSSRTFLVSWLIFKSFIHLEFIFVYSVKSLVQFPFLTCGCPDLPTPFVEEAIVTPFYASSPFVKYIEIWVYFWVLYSVTLIYVSALMPVPDCFDYHGLEYSLVSGILITPALFFLQNSCYLGLFMVPYIFLKCLFYICDICHWYSNKDCTEL